VGQWKRLDKIRRSGLMLLIADLGSQGLLFMYKPRLLLEADRERLYKEMPVPEGWHEDYARGRVTTDDFLKAVG